MPSNDATQAPEPTICVRCKHVRFSEELCKANPRKNYFTGGDIEWGCRIKNDKGTCPDYEEAKDE